MPDIFEYLDYREFLRDFFTAQKAKSPHFSYKYLANKAGFKSKSFIHDVLNRKKNLSRDSIFALRSVLGLNEKAFSYFELLVAFNQAADHKQKDHFFHQVIGYNSRNRARLFTKAQYEVCSHWYHMTIRELAVAVDFKNDFDRLGRMLQPSISAKKARQSVSLLCKLGLLRKIGTTGRYEQTERLVTTGDEVHSLAVHNFHLQNMAIAAESMDTVPRNQRDISSVVLGLSPEGFETAKAEIQKFRKKLLELAEKESGISRVYHANFQIFPTTRDISNENR
jgi:uncharacterized protein (TIGR02147 family)